MTNAKSVITIEMNEQGQIKLEVINDPCPEGTHENWHLPARVADRMVKNMLALTRSAGLEPIMHMTKDKDGHVHVTRRDGKGRIKDHDEP